MKKRKSGIGRWLVCLLLLLCGLYLLRERLPDSEGASEHVQEIRQKIQERIREKNGPADYTEEEMVELLEQGHRENTCAYYYWQLEDSLELEYLRLLHSLQNMEPEFGLAVEEETMKLLVEMVFADHPELFFAEQSYNYSVYEDWVQIRPVYNCSPEERELRQQQVESTVQEALALLPEEMSGYDCIQALYTYVVNTVSYDLDATDNQNLYSSMVNRVSVCTGYAKELQYLLQRVGIQAVCVEGEVTGQGPHAWLIVNCEGEYYHVDPTYGDPSYQDTGMEERGEFPGALQVDYSYLCCDSAMILQERTLKRAELLPACESKTYLYYPQKGRFFTECSDAVLISFQESIDAGERYWDGQFADAASYQEMVRMTQDGAFADLILANHPDWESVSMHMSFRDDSRVVKLWY
ncbi:MAG: transglutaminase domain-containing protein [Lachnospiraceae bacterium]|nr:transglutaminase domain-containing protein [Lachnospiraceae bacterium]